MDVILSHANADFDSLGGTVGAARLYPGAALVLPDGAIPAVSSFRALHQEVLNLHAPTDIDPQAITRIVVVDTARRSQLGPAAVWLDLPDVEVHLYDHRPDVAGDIAAAFERVEPLGAVSSVITRVLEERGITPTPLEATLLLLGIYEDTGSLSYAGTTQEDLAAATWLLGVGGDLEVVSEFTHWRLNPEQRGAFQSLLHTADTQEIRGIRIVVATAPGGTSSHDLPLLASRLLDQQGVDAAFVLAEGPGAVLVFGQSRSAAINMGSVLRELGGGGHAREAWAALSISTAAVAKGRLITLLEQHIPAESSAGEIMTCRVPRISATTTVAEARRRMAHSRQPALIVMQQGRFAGLLTRSGLNEALARKQEHEPVRKVMECQPCTVTAEMPVSELERLLTNPEVGPLPVTRNGDVVGLVTRSDVLRALHGERYLAGTSPVGETPVSQLISERLPARVQRLLQQVGQLASREECRGYVVGGFVRDLLLDEPNLDLDVVVEPDGAALARAFASECGGEVTEVDARYGTAKVRLADGFEVDFATARREAYAYPGAPPEITSTPIEDDLRRRDFTINAMAVALRPECYGELLDPFGGHADVRSRRLRVLHPLSFAEDPARLFRAVRFEARLHLRMDPHTEALARQALEEDALTGIEPGRLRTELYHLFREPRAPAALARLQSFGVPERLHRGWRFDLTLLRSVARALEWWRQSTEEPVRPERVYLAAILSPLSIEDAGRFGRDRLDLSPPDLSRLNAALHRLREIESLLPSGTSPSALTRGLHSLTPEELILLRCGACSHSRSSKGRCAALEQFVCEWRHVRLEATGDDLKALGFDPGPQFRAALDATLEAKLNGEVRGREAELRYAAAWLERQSEAHPPADRVAHGGVVVTRN